LTAADYGPAQPAAAMPQSGYPLQALLYSVVPHRFLRWRQPGHDPSRHLRGLRYLFLRGVSGAQTPVIGGEPCGVLSWRPPVEPVTALPDLLATGERAAWVSTLTRSGRVLRPGCPGGGLDASHIGAQEWHAVRCRRIATAANVVPRHFRGRFR
jgi:hypothetical protein